MTAEQPAVELNRFGKPKGKPGRPKESLPDDPLVRRSLKSAERLYREARSRTIAAKESGDNKLEVECAREARQAAELVARIRGDLSRKPNASPEDERILQEHKSLASASEHQVAEQCASFLALYNLRHPDRPKVVRASGKPGRFRATG